MRFDFKAVEDEILKFWKEHKIYDKVKSRNKSKDNSSVWFYFLDGPPYTNGKVHLGTAWNKSLKDAFLRFKRMNGFNVFDKAGWDMHGMPIEVALEKKLGLKSRLGIEDFGVDKFIKACKDFAFENLKKMQQDFVKLGVWMDFDNAYKSVERDFISGEWWLVKQAFDQNRLYEALKTMHWCARCGTALAKHELEYKTVKDKSIFVKFRVKNSDNKFLIVWTTTPWTLAFNLAVMVNPDLEYVEALVDGEVWIIAKALAGSVIQGLLEKSFEVLKTFKGSELEGLDYEHPFKLKVFEDLKKQYKRVHTVVLSSEYVTATAGTGLVHCAPGCGPEDYEVGLKYGLPAFNNIDEKAVFPESMEQFSGLTAKKDDEVFINALKSINALVAETFVEHEYAHCWRCKQPVVFRTTKQWFFKVEDLKQEMLKANTNVKWVPEWAGSKSFASWLGNLRDNSITRQRFWGTPVPIWKCNKCGNIKVFGSVEELEQESGLKLDSIEKLHKPFIDDVVFKCDKCDGLMKRIPDVLDVWIDAGTTSWNALEFPKHKELFEKLFPADLIIEGKDQIRGWFNLLLIASMLGFKKHPYKACYMHGFVNDAYGRKMSKSLGNYITPKEALDRFGVDAWRLYSITATKPGEDMNYNFEDVRVRFRTLQILWNLHNYLIDLKNSYNLELLSYDKIKKFLDVEEFYIFSRVQSVVGESTKHWNNYHLELAPRHVEDLILELSRSYVQFVREKVAVGSLQQKQAVLYALYHSLTTLLKLLAPVTPFITEKIWQDLKKDFRLLEDSVHLCYWPKPVKEFIDKQLEQEFMVVEDVVSACLSAREKAKITTRWPLRNVFIKLDDTLDKNANKELKKALERLLKLLKTRVNAKEVLIVETLPDQKTLIKEAFSKGVIALDTELDDQLIAEALSREISRRVQALRSKARLNKNQMIMLQVGVGNINKKLADLIKQFGDYIKIRTGANVLGFKHSVEKGLTYNSSFKIKDYSLSIGFDVLG